MNGSFSYWEKRTFFEGIDVAVIGSGIVGLFSALEVKRKFPALKVAVLERGMLPDGASTKNAGFCCFGSLSELLDDLNHFTLEESMNLVNLRFQGLKKLRHEVGDENMDYKPCGGFELFTKNDEEIIEKCHLNIEKYNNLLNNIIGEKVYVSDPSLQNLNGFSDSIISVIKNNYEGSVNTGKLMKTLLKKVQLNDILILNNFRINEFFQEDNGVRILSDQGSLKVRKMLVTTNGFARQLLPSLEVQPARAQVLVTSVIPDLRVEGTFHYDKGYNYFRNIEGRILLGGGRNLAFEEETTTEMEVTQKIQSHLEKMLHEIILPGRNFSIDYRWSGIMGVGPIKQPIIQKISDDVYVAVRMGGMGVAIGSKVGEMASELIAKDI